MRAELRQRVLLFLKGMAMGAADSVPGVSGGTIAFISNIYDELLASIKAITPANLRLCFTQGPLAAWSAINGSFLLTLGLGILSSLLLSAHVVLWLLAYQYTYLMCFFTGLILASLWYISKQLPRWNLARAAILTAGILLSMSLAILPGFQGVDHLWYYFFCGAIAICAMLLPGISGAFILLLLGAYEPVLNALTGMDWPVILVFASGCLCGLLSFSRVLYWLLLRHRALTLAGLLGVLAGSLYSLWPWRLPSQDAPGYQNVLPGAFDAVTGQVLSPMLALALLLFGFILVLGLEQLGDKSGVKSTSSAFQK